MKRWRAQGMRVQWHHRMERVVSGDLLFILGFFRIVPPSILARNHHNLVVHESRLPQGRGWSPMSWDILTGHKKMTLSLFEAVERVDAGPIYLQRCIRLKGTELLAELRGRCAREMVGICREFVRSYPGIVKKARPQRGKPTYYRQRSPRDGELNPRRSFADQFDLLRISDPLAYPAFFRWRGATYIVRIERRPQ